MTEYDANDPQDAQEPEWVTKDARTLLERDSDIGAAEQAKKDAMEPAGQYISDPDGFPLTSTVENFKGRVTVQLSGLVTLVKPKDKGYEMPERPVRTRLNFFRLSPDRRNKLVYGDDNKPTGEETNIPDASTLRWLEARDAYKTLYGEEAKQDIQIVDFLTERPITFILFQGRQGLGVSKLFVRK